MGHQKKGKSAAWVKNEVCAEGEEKISPTYIDHQSHLSGEGILWQERVGEDLSTRQAQSRNGTAEHKGIKGVSGIPREDKGL